MYLEFLKMRVYPATIGLTSLVGSFFSPVYAFEKSYEQRFIVTAYYSPVPDQCCYFRGNYEDEILFNGKGVSGADGTPVYPGMIAAPDSYMFGTVIALDGIGTGTVHDRGGRIIEWGEDAHRIDLWMGYGEEGLARAMAWGVRTVKGTVYPTGVRPPDEDWSLERFDADSSLLASLPKSEPVTLLRNTAFGDRGYGVRILQQSLKDLGYFSDNVTGQFGPVTQDALRRFLSEFGLEGDGSSADLRIASALVAVQDIGQENLPLLDEGLSEGASGSSVRQAQKLLRYLGYYRGRTDGVFGQSLKEAVTRFQVEHGVIGAVTDVGSGRIGPSTKAAVLKAWKVQVVGVKTEKIMDKAKVAERVKQERLPSKLLSKGDRGNDVRRLQSFLQNAGYLPASDMTGTFGARTASALLQYQLDRGILDSDQAKGAGVFGPSTKLAVSRDMIDLSWSRVRAGGMSSL